MPMISVRALPDRVVYDAPRGGKKVAPDAFVMVPDTPYIRRLINHWGDLELEAKKPATPVGAPAANPGDYTPPVSTATPPPPPPPPADVLRTDTQVPTTPPPAPVPDPDAL